MKIATRKGVYLGECSNCECPVRTSDDVLIRIETDAEGDHNRFYQHASQDDCREALRRFMRGF